MITLRRLKNLFNAYNQKDENGNNQLNMTLKMDIDKFGIMQVELSAFFSKAPDK